MPRAKRKLHPPIAVGEHFGNFTVIAGPILRPNGIKPVWLLRHTCGATYPASKHSLRTKPRTYCPACMVPSWTGTKRTPAAKAKIAAALTTHGMRRTPEYETWCAIQQRCHNPKNAKYSRYGKRGIVVCDRWRNSFDAFYEDMGIRPEGMTLERENNDGPYSPDNCVWASRATQARNKSNTIFVDTPEGRVPLQQIAERAGENAKAVFNRVRYLGWSVEDALNVPVERDREKRCRVVVETGNGPRPLAVLCRSAGMPYDVVKQRLVRGWEIGRALSEPFKPKPKRRRAA